MVNINVHLSMITTIFSFITIFRPLLVIGGSSDIDQEGMGAFQEWPQVQNYKISSSCLYNRLNYFKVESVRTSCKMSARVHSLETMPFFVEKV